MSKQKEECLCENEKRGGRETKRTETNRKQKTWNTLITLQSMRVKHENVLFGVKAVDRTTSNLIWVWKFMVHNTQRSLTLLNQRKKKRFFMTTTTKRMIVCASSDQPSATLYNQHSPLSIFPTSCDSGTLKDTHTETRVISASQTYEIIHFKRRIWLNKIRKKKSKHMWHCRRYIRI